MQRQLYMERIQKLKSMMGKLDAVVATSLENTYYFSGSHIMTIREIPNRLAMLLIPKEGDPVYMVCVIEESLARKESAIKDVRGYVEFQENPADVLVKALGEKGLDRGNIGIEAQHISTMYIERLRRAAPGATWQPVDALLGQLRAIKSPWEVRILADGANATREAIEEAWKNARIGATEKSVAVDMANEMLSRGLDSVSFLCMGAGSHCGDAHPTPGPHKLHRGELIRCDVGGLFKRYQTDMARTGVVGRPTPTQSKRYEAVYEAQRQTIEAMKPGAVAGDLWRISAKVLKSYGYSLDSPHIGHSVGVGLHEEPMIQPRNSAVLELGMVCYIEPAFSPVPRDEYHVEDLVAVTEEGGKVLSDPHETRAELFVL